MIKEITKNITTKITVCDICNEPANYMCAVCNKDICSADCISIYGNNGNVVYLCEECNKKPFDEIWFKIAGNLNTTIQFFPIPITTTIVPYYPTYNTAGNYYLLSEYTII